MQCSEFTICFGRCFFANKCIGSLIQSAPECFSESSMNQTADFLESTNDDLIGAGSD